MRVGMLHRPIQRDTTYCRLWQRLVTMPPSLEGVMLAVYL
jgi:hypothetical protein